MNAELKHGLFPIKILCLFAYRRCVYFTNSLSELTARFLDRVWRDKVSPPVYVMLLYRWENDLHLKLPNKDS